MDVDTWLVRFRQVVDAYEASVVEGGNDPSDDAQRAYDEAMEGLAHQAAELLRATTGPGAELLEPILVEEGTAWYSGAMWRCPHCGHESDLLAIGEHGWSYFKGGLMADGSIVDMQSTDEDYDDSKLWCRECDTELAFPSSAQ